MTAVTQQSVQNPNLYANNMQLAWGSNTTLTVAAGQIRDNTNAYDIVFSATKTLNAATNGANGLDTGALANSTWYYLFAIADTTQNLDPALLLSTSRTAPYLPGNYDVFVLIGMARTDGSAHFLKFYTAGSGTEREYFWDDSISVLSNGSATSLTAISLAAAVPPINNTPVKIDVDFTPATAGHKSSYAPFGSTATVLPHVTGSVAAQITSGELLVLSKVDSGAAKILYINSAASGDADVWVSGFKYYI